MSHDVPYGDKNANDLERSDSVIKEAKQNDLTIEELGAGAASKSSGLLGKVNALCLLI